MLSIIIPHFHEHPQLIFTLQSLINELECTDVCYEIILIDNAPTAQHDHVELDSVKYIEKKQNEGCLKRVISLSYTDSLSHWQAKNLGIKSAVGDLLLFLDAHVIVSPGAIKGMINHFNTLPEHSLLHLPIAYMLDNKQNFLMYELVSDLEKGLVDYKFALVLTEASAFETACMSTCGMMISTETMVDKFNGWPSSLGSYSGGEHYTNFVGAVLGIRKFILNAGAVYHYAAPRSYDLSYEDVYRNRAIATYLIDGEEMLNRYLDNIGHGRRGRISLRAVNKIRVEIPDIPELQERRQYIKINTTISIDAWIEKWRNNVQRQQNIA